MAKITKTNEQWKVQLTDEQYRVTREQVTEAPFSGEFDQFFSEGRYSCVCCGAELFVSSSKFDAGCGWPSFDRPSGAGAVDEHDDSSLPARPRIEVTCHQCGAHLGHVFDDGPTESGRRYCINSVALNFAADHNEEGS